MGLPASRGKNIYFPRGMTGGGEKITDAVALSGVANETTVAERSLAMAHVRNPSLSRPRRAPFFIRGTAKQNCTAPQRSFECSLVRSESPRPADSKKSQWTD